MAAYSYVSVFFLMYTTTCTAMSVRSSPGSHIELRALDPTSVTNPQSFYNRAWHSSIVFGHFLYIDGGEISFNDNGTVINLPENSTYSIDLTSSWTNQTAPIVSIDKDIQTYNQENLWIDASNSFFYSYNGGVSWDSPSIVPPPNALSQFTPSGVSGNWSTPGVAANSNFSSIVRTQQAASTCGNGVCYALGGVQSWRTSSLDSFWCDGCNRFFDLPTPGMVSFNTSSGVWSNTTTSEPTLSGTFVAGQLEYVPNVGTAGILVALGGQTATAVSLDNESDIDFNSVLMYDPDTAIWHNQTVRGDVIPPPRSLFCSVGVQGDNETYEIFIYGGISVSSASPSAYTDLDTVYVLSLPAFAWQKTTYTPANARYVHTCNIVGKRQMVVVGGLNPNENKTITPDIWTQGLGIFDLSDMEWKDHYNASAKPYVTPEVVKDYYQQNGRYPTFSDDIVKSWFIKDGECTA